MHKNNVKIAKLSGIFLLSVNLLLSQITVSSARTLQVGAKRNHMFFDTDLAVCGVVVNLHLSEDCYDDGLTGTYYHRTATVLLTMTGNASAKCSVLNPVHVNSSGKTVNSFSGWKNFEVLREPSTINAYSKQNDTSVRYSKNNANYLRVSYVVGDVGFVGVSEQAGKLELALKLPVC